MIWRPAAEWLREVFNLIILFPLLSLFVSPVESCGKPNNTSSCVADSSASGRRADVKLCCTWAAQTTSVHLKIPAQAVYLPSYMCDCLLPDGLSCLFLCAATTPETTPASMEATAPTESCPVTVYLASSDTGTEEVFRSLKIKSVNTIL